MWDKTKEFFLAGYASEKLITKKRNQGLLALSLSLLGMTGLLAILIDLPSVRMALVGMAVFAVILLALIRLGKAELANIATTVVMSLVFASTVFLQPFKEGNELYTIVSYEAMTLIVAGYIGRRGLQLIGVLGVGVAGLLLDYYLRIVPAGAGSVNWINLMIGLFVLVVSTLVARAIMRRDDLLLAMAEEEAEHSRAQLRDLESVIFSSKDALGMGRAVSESSERTRERIGHLKVLLGSASASLAEFGSKAARIEAASREIAASSALVGQRISEQGAIVAQSSAAIEEMTASIDSIAKVTAARRESLSQLEEATGSGSREMEEASRSVRMVEESMAEIDQVVKVIRSVSSQTNLLAMNAAIEAAHAGVSGTGFSVVAGEVRKLSEETDRQVKLIDASIKRTVGAVRGAASITGEARSTFARISSETGAVAKAMGEIAGGVGELSTGSGEILAGVSQSVSITTSVKDASGKVDEKIAAVSLDLESLAAGGAAIGDLVAEISQLLDKVLADAEVLAKAGDASESGLHSLSSVIEGLRGR